jgi:recombination protein RecT
MEEEKKHLPHCGANEGYMCSCDDPPKTAKLPEVLQKEADKMSKSADASKDSSPSSAVQTTGVALRPPSDPIRIMLAGQMKALNNFLGGEQNALRFMSAVSHVAQKVPKLKQCSLDSLIGAFMECAALGLYPGTAAGDCYVIPYGNVAQFQIGYRGLKTLAYRSGITICDAEVVYANDKFKEVLGTSPRLEHERTTAIRGEPIGAYAWAEVNGRKIFRYMTKEDIMKIKEMSKAKNNGPWASGDPMLWMWMKTVFKQMAKLLPTSEKIEGENLARAIQVDNINERGGYIVGTDRQLVEVAFEESEDEKIDAGKAKKAAMKPRKK